jgi:2-polyprenyl-3-methyl-5-hydroxy-6-metoxy-1,4-benzoquinol methylase
VKDPASATAVQAWDAVDAFESNGHNWWVRLEHLGRYLFAADYLRSEGAGRVLDAASGTGFGAGELARAGLGVLGVDNDPAVLAYARDHYGEPSVRYCQADLEAADLALPEEGFEALVSFETLEHLIDPAASLRKLTVHLASGGIVICSLPIRVAEGRTAIGLPANAFHKQLLSLDGAQRLLEEAGLRIEYRLGQSLVARLMKRERKAKFGSGGKSKPSSLAALSEPEALRGWARLVGLPTPEDVEESYSVTFVARRP